MYRFDVRAKAAGVEIDGKLAFDNPIRVPLVGLIVAYRGTLKPEAASIVTAKGA